MSLLRDVLLDAGAFMTDSHELRPRTLSLSTSNSSCVPQRFSHPDFFNDNFDTGRKLSHLDTFLMLPTLVYTHFLILGDGHMAVISEGWISSGSSGKLRASVQSWDHDFPSLVAQSIIVYFGNTQAVALSHNKQYFLPYSWISCVSYQVKAFDTCISSSR